MKSTIQPRPAKPTTATLMVSKLNDLHILMPRGGCINLTCDVTVIYGGIYGSSHRFVGDTIAVKGDDFQKANNDITLSNQG